METEFSPSLIIWLAVGAYLTYVFIKAGKRDKAIMLRGTPYLGLKIEWPAFCTGTIAIENGPTFNFPNDLNDENMLYAR